MKKFLEEFKAFAIKGNVSDMAVGMMIGSAFGKIVTSLVNDIIMPLVATLTNSGDFSSLKILLIDKGEESVYLAYGNFIQTIFDFLIIALCIFLFVKFMNNLKKKEEEKPAEEPKPSEELVALQRIVELLEEK